MKLMSCKNVCLGYDGHVIVNGLNFDILKGDYLNIVGENGSGKSTLMRTLLGLQSPLSGSIVMENGFKQSDIGYLPQQTAAQKDFPASVYEIVVSGCLNRCGLRPFYSKPDKERAYENMEKLNITDLSKRCFRELSGGQQQRVLLARALCSASTMLLLDEPVSGLDPSATEEMYELVARLNREDGTTIVMISHDIPSVLKYSTHVLHIGYAPSFYGSPADYKADNLGNVGAGSEVRHVR